MTGGFGWFHFWQEMPYAIRQLGKSPAFPVAAVLTLALGIGVNAAMLSVIDRVLLRAKPFPNTASGLGPRSTECDQLCLSDSVTT